MVVTLLLLHVEGLAIEHARMPCPLALGLSTASAADYIQNHFADAANADRIDLEYSARIEADVSVMRLQPGDPAGPRLERCIVGWHAAVLGRIELQRREVDKE